MKNRITNGAPVVSDALTEDEYFPVENLTVGQNHNLGGRAFTWDGRQWTTTQPEYLVTAKLCLPNAINNEGSTMTQETSTATKLKSPVTAVLVLLRNRGYGVFTQRVDGMLTQAYDGYIFKYYATAVDAARSLAWGADLADGDVFYGTFNGIDRKVATLSMDVEINRVVDDLVSALQSDNEFVNITEAGRQSFYDLYVEVVVPYRQESTRPIIAWNTLLEAFRKNNDKLLLNGYHTAIHNLIQSGLDLMVKDQPKRKKVVKEIQGVVDVYIRPIVVQNFDNVVSQPEGPDDTTTGFSIYAHLDDGRSICIADEENYQAARKQILALSASSRVPIVQEDWEKNANLLTAKDLGITPVDIYVGSSSGEKEFDLSQELQTMLAETKKRWEAHAAQQWVEITQSLADYQKKIQHADPYDGKAADRKAAAVTTMQASAMKPETTKVFDEPLYQERIVSPSFLRFKLDLDKEIVPNRRTLKIDRKLNNDFFSAAQRSFTKAFDSHIDRIILDVKHAEAFLHDSVAKVAENLFSICLEGFTVNSRLISGTLNSQMMLGALVRTVTVVLLRHVNSEDASYFIKGMANSFTDAEVAPGDEGLKKILIIKLYDELDDLSKSVGKTIPQGVNYTTIAWDRLSGISLRAYGTPEHADILLDANHSRIADPENLQVGTSLFIPPLSEIKFYKARK